MKIALLGPLCKDKIYFDGHLAATMAGSPVFYTGSALGNLELTPHIYCSLAKQDQSLLKSLPENIVLTPTWSEGTIQFQNYYVHFDERHRRQKIQWFPNPILIEEIKTSFDQIILCPLFYDQLNLDHLQSFISKYPGSLGLCAQGLLRHQGNRHQILLKSNQKILNSLKNLNLIALNSEELKVLTQTKNEQQGIEILLKLNIQTLLITKDQEGSLIVESGQIYEIPAYSPRKLVDPTGAGDTYLAGYLKGKNLFPHSPLQAGQFAAMTATLSIEDSGPFQSNSQEVFKRLSKIEKGFGI